MLGAVLIVTRHPPILHRKGHLTMPMPKRIHETITAPILEAPADTPGRMLIEIVNAGWGSSGYYSTKVLDNTVAEKVWPAARTSTRPPDRV